jgi:signal recognition particle subunit SRP54
MEQLAILGIQAELETLNIVSGEPPVAIARRALQKARLEAFDVVLLDTAGRLHIDDELMAEVAEVRDAVQPKETLLVVDAMTGQDAVNVAQAFKDKVGVTGIVMTRVDGDARGGAALSMRAVTGCPIKLIGVGEKLDALEDFHPSRIAGRILGMGDVVSLVEKAAETIEQEEAERLAAKMQKGQFDLDDLAQQLKQLQKMGGLDSIMSMLPGIGKMQRQMAEAKIDPKLLKRQQAIISSMTKQERRKPELIKASRKRRIATGAGVPVQAVNQLLNQFEQMQKMMKMMKGGNLQRMMRGMKGMLPGMR